MKWLGHIIIGTSIKARHLIAPAITRRENKNWRFLASAAPFFQNTHAVQNRKAKIENNGVIGFGVAEKMTLFAIMGFISVKTRSTCTVDLQIADVQTGTFALYVRDLTIDSTAGKGALTQAAGMIPTFGWYVAARFRIDAAAVMAALVPYSVVTIPVRSAARSCPTLPR